jgi:uncharacterized PurR-regulated membrane protein YhhQ (DUF165 family)
MDKPRLTLTLAATYIGLVVTANVMTSHLGLLPAGFGLMVTAGTFAAGLTIAVRNPLQEVAGRRWVFAAILVGAVLSYLLGAGRIAIASGVTFLVAETLDMTVYTWLRKHGWKRAVVAGITVGAVVDTVLFLALAGFGLSWPVVAGQLLVKAVYAGVLGFPMVKAVLRAVPRQPVEPESA